MIRILTLITCFLSLTWLNPDISAAAQEPSIARQDIEITLNPARHLLTGRSALTVAPGTHSLSLRLSPAATVESVTLSGTKLPFTFADGILTLALPKEDAAGAMLAAITYHAVFNDPLPQTSGSSEDPTYGINGVISSQGTFLGAGAGWYPAPASLPRKRAVRITAPSGIEAVTAGRRLSRGTDGSGTHSSWEEANPVSGLSLCAGPFQIEEKRMNGVDLYTYFYPQNASLSSRYLEAAAKYIRFYSDLFGPYPFEKFAVVENFFPTGYGFPSFTLLGGSIIRLPFIIDTSFPHEIAHSWWGNGIEVDQREGNWSEGLVTYLADYLLKEKRAPAEGREYRMQLLADYASLVTPDSDFPLTGFTSRVDPASRTIGYGKSAMLFHMIRGEIGDQAFFAALREICRERLYRTAAWSDFEHAFSHSSGREVAPFMKQWLTRRSGPRLSLTDVTRRREGTGWITSGTIVQTAPLYELHVPLLLESGETPVREQVPVDREQTPFSIRTPAEPRKLSLDPDADLFRVLAPGEVPVTVNSLKGSKKLLAVMTKDCRADTETFGRLLESLGQNKGAIVREDELDAGRLSGHDLLFCGAPQQRALLPLPSGISLNDGKFTVPEGEVQGPDGLLFLVLRQPESPGRVVALFQPLSGTAAGQYAPKITHYGKYGTLVFSGGAIRYKGTIQPPAEGNVVTFPRQEARY